MNDLRFPHSTGFTLHVKTASQTDSEVPNGSVFRLCRTFAEDLAVVAWGTTVFAALP